MSLKYPFKIQKLCVQEFRFKMSAAYCETIQCICKAKDFTMNFSDVNTTCLTITFHRIKCKM